MGVLDEIERSGRSRIKERAGRDPNLPFLRAFFVAFGMMPVMVFESLFVAIFGHLLVLLAIALSLLYLWVRRSIWLAVVALLGSVTSLVGMVMIMGGYGPNLHLPMAYLLAGSTGTMIAYLFVISGALVAVYDRASSQTSPVAM